MKPNTPGVPRSRRGQTPPVVHCDPLRRNKNVVDFTEEKLIRMIARSPGDAKKLQNALEMYCAGLIAVWWTGDDVRWATVQ